MEWALYRTVLLWSGRYIGLCYYGVAVYDSLLHVLCDHFHHWAYAASANNVKHDILKWQNQGKSLKLHIGRDIFLVLNKKHDFLCAEDKKCHGMKMDAIPATIMTRVPKCQMFV